MANTDKTTNETKAPDAAPAAAAPPPAPVAPAPRPNLTRDSIELTVRAKQIELGKSEAEASAFAKKRALEMIPE